ncbi:transcription factor HES-5-like isoform 1-T1 [Synchiropus picturatus]
MKPAEITFSLQRPLQHTDPDMAPTATAALSTSQEHLTLSHKLRKPLVEKLRRERINSSIEQLKSLLGPEFLKQQPDSKLEKADILEMTVCFLRRLQPHLCVDSKDQGFSRCVQEAANFLSNREKMESERRLLEHFHHLEKNQRETDLSPLSSTYQISVSTEKSTIKTTPWRPW